MTGEGGSGGDLQGRRSFGSSKKVGAVIEVAQSNQSAREEFLHGFSLMVYPS